MGVASAVMLASRCVRARAAEGTLALLGIGQPALDEALRKSDEDGVRG